MPGTDRPIAYRDAQGRARFSVGVLNGAVYECVNNNYVDADPWAVPINIGDAVSLQRSKGSIAPFLPTAADLENPRPTILAVQIFTPEDPLADDTPFGIALDNIPYNGGRGRVAGIGCLIHTLIHNEYDVDGGYVVRGDGIDGPWLKATPMPFGTIGFATTHRQNAGQNASWAGVLVRLG